MATTFSETRADRLWNAAIPAVAALLGAVLGGVGTYVATNRQIGAERHEVVRSDRKSAYASLLTAADGVMSEITELAPVSKQLLPSDEEHLTASLNSARLQALTVQIEGSAGMVEIAGHVYDDLSSYVTDFEATGKTEGRYRDGATDSLSAFLHQARKDLLS